MPHVLVPEESLDEFLLFYRPGLYTYSVVPPANPPETIAPTTEGSDGARAPSNTPSRLPTLVEGRDLVPPSTFEHPVTPSRPRHNIALLLEAAHANHTLRHPPVPRTPARRRRNAIEPEQQQPPRWTGTMLRSGGGAWGCGVSDRIAIEREEASADKEEWYLEIVGYTKVALSLAGREMMEEVGERVGLRWCGEDHVWARDVRTPRGFQMPAGH